MRPSLAKWVRDADALRHLEHFRVQQATTEFAHIRTRAEDYYLSLVGELFQKMREGYEDSASWARLGNALALFADGGEEFLRRTGVSASETALFAAAAFYSGGYPASSYLTIKNHPPSPTENDEIQLACFDLLARPVDVRSRIVRGLLAAIRRGQVDNINRAVAMISERTNSSLNQGPSKWIALRILSTLLERFQRTNLRAVLPEGETDFWNDLVASFLNRRPSTWEFFPSQMEAIQNGLLERQESFSIQMPTGAGKTALCETLLYWHLRRNADEAAIFLVPFRSLASELRRTLVKKLNDMGISSRCAYGGTVPSGNEVQELDDTQLIVATPESLSGILSANPKFLNKISLVICDEGHLLDGGARGIGLELLLARMRARAGGAPKFVFVSAIIPNIEEINTWLGGTDTSVVRSTFRPAVAEFALLSPSGTGTSLKVDLNLHPHEEAADRYAVEGFLARSDFQWTNPETGRQKTYPFTSVKAQAVASARKALPMGAVAIFAANKLGNQGAVGVAEELLKQLDTGLNLPAPSTFMNAAAVNEAVRYLSDEYGPRWILTRALAVGAVVHHGDVPQETREIVEHLLANGDVKLAICTSTLAEGVNLPIRTLVLYSVQRRIGAGPPENMLTRDIKNLVGRAGRAGSNTKGLVICANPGQWPLVEQVARQSPGEQVTGALLELLGRLRKALARPTIVLTNEWLESRTALHALVDGIDSTLIDLTTEEIGEDELIRLAKQISDTTFAAQQADDESKELLQNVFELRAKRIIGIRTAGRLDWIKETGARTRMLDTVETALLPAVENWEDVTDPLDPTIVDAFLNWAWPLAELKKEVRQAYALDKDTDINTVKDVFFRTVTMWLDGSRFIEIANDVNMPMDDLLGVHTRCTSFALQTIIEQGVALLEKLLESQDRTLSPVVMQFPDYLRFGVPTSSARVLSMGGIRHRCAAVQLGGSDELRQLGFVEDRTIIFGAAKQLIDSDEALWQRNLGEMVFGNTLDDLIGVLGEEQA